MNFKTINRDDIENMSYDDLAYIILKENNDKMKITDIFKIICQELHLNNNVYEEKIGDFFSLLATEKRFIQLEKGYWDLRENHTSEISISDLEEELEDDEEIPVENYDTNDIDVDDEDEAYYNETGSEDDDNGEDDLKDLVIVDENYDEEL